MKRVDQDGVYELGQQRRASGMRFISFKGETSAYAMESTVTMLPSDYSSFIEVLHFVKQYINAQCLKGKTPSAAELREHFSHEPMLSAERVDDGDWECFIDGFAPLQNTKGPKKPGPKRAGVSGIAMRYYARKTSLSFSTIKTLVSRSKTHQQST